MSAPQSGETCPAILAEKASSLDALLALQEYCIALQHLLHVQEMYHVAEIGGLVAQQDTGSLQRRQNLTKIFRFADFICIRWHSRGNCGLS